jgi:branched-chain amino acid transport system ATP-binding protein
MLEYRDIDAFYGKVQALFRVSLNVKESEIVALVGSNGAGKTTLLSTISGLLHPSSGTVEFLGEEINGLTSYAIVELGISHIPEGRKLFPDMSIRENLEMGGYIHRAWKKKGDTLEKIYEIFPILKTRHRQLARTLSGGEQQMLAMARGLMSGPKLCMIDEPSSGLAPIMFMEVFHVIESLRDQGITILLIEQNVRHTLEISDRAYVLENGRIVLEGSSGELLEKEMIKKAYLGL